MTNSYNLYNPSALSGPLICICCGADKGSSHDDDCEVGKLEARVAELEAELEQIEDDLQQAAWERDLLD